MPSQAPSDLRQIQADKLRAARLRRQPLIEVACTWPRHAADEGVRTIGEAINVLTGTMRPTAVSLEAEQIDDLLLRCERFLRSGMPYRWPDPRARLAMQLIAGMGGIVLLLVVAGFVFSSQTLLHGAAVVFPAGLLILAMTLLSPDRSRYGFRLGRLLTDETWPFTPEQMDRHDSSS
ncbi:MAG: hypothetical protein ACLFUJ_08465 [Phycisphaerae bacterium]